MTVWESRFTATPTATSSDGDAQAETIADDDPRSRPRTDARDEVPTT
jgi:hypothetical protein